MIKLDSRSHYHHLYSHMRMIATHLLNFCFPPHCLRCREGVSEYGTFCPVCWQQLAFISEPLCLRCGVPFIYQPGTLDRCMDCYQAPPPFSQARAVLRYDEASKPLVLRLKYQDDTALAAHYGPWLQRAGASLLEGCDGLVPVPLHYWRFVKRRYNQALLLASTLSKVTSLPVIAALRRVRPTKPQTTLPAPERKSNVAGAFVTLPSFLVKGKTLLLIDDVYTTGATLTACAEALLTSGAREVRALTLARRC